MTHAPVPSSPEASRPPLFLLLGVVLAHVLRWGYAYGSGDHDELLPQVLHALDSDLFIRDWFVTGQADSLTVRTAFVELLHLLGLLIPLPLAVGLLHLGVLLAIAYGAYRLAITLGAERLGAALGTFAAVVLLPRWTLGSNALTYGLLVPETLGWALALPALRLFIEGKRWQPAVLLAGATWFQLLVGLHVAGVLGIVGLWTSMRDRDRQGILQTLGFGALFGVLTAPLALAVLLAPPDPEATAVARHSLFYVMATLRVPHHYLPSAFPLGDYLRFALVLMAGAMAFVVMRRRGALRYPAFIQRFLFVVAGLCVLATVFTEIWPVYLVAQFQVFKLTVLVSMLLVLLASAGLASILPSRLYNLGSRLLDAKTAGLVVMGGVLLLTSGLVLGDVAPFANRYEPAVHAASDLGQVEAWIQNQTPTDALLLIPPSNTTTRMGAQRSVVANFKPTPFQKGAMHLWLDRLLAVAPVPLPEQGTGFREALDAAYAANDVAAWGQLAERFGATHALVNRAVTPTPPSAAPLVHHGTWALYPLAPRLP